MLNKSYIHVLFILFPNMCISKLSSIFVSCFIVLQIFIQCKAISTVNHRQQQQLKLEVQSLKILFQQTNSAGTWLNSSNWLIDPNHCKWYGILCDDNHVTSIHLYNNGLVGKLHKSLANLRFLHTLNVSDNVGLFGSIPFSLFTLRKLQTITFSGTKLHWFNSNFDNSDEFNNFAPIGNNFGIIAHAVNGSINDNDNDNNNNVNPNINIVGNGNRVYLRTVIINYNLNCNSEK